MQRCYDKIRSERTEIWQFCTIQSERKFYGVAEICPLLSYQLDPWYKGGKIYRWMLIFVGNYCIMFS